MSLPTVVVVNDSAVASAVICAIIKASGQYQLIAQATTGQQGIELICKHKPRLVVLDMHMPDITGVEVTREIMQRCPTRILICSATVRRNTRYMFEALNLGALDYIRTPSLMAKPGQRLTNKQMLSAGKQLLHKLRLLNGLSLKQSPEKVVKPEQIPARAIPLAIKKLNPHSAAVPLILIGCSTGGPTALKNLFKALPVNLKAAIVIVQHIEKGFSEGLARWLSLETGHTVREAKQGDHLLGGIAYVAQGGRTNLLISKALRISYENSGDAIYYPNINRTFATAVEAVGNSCCGIIMTGLGNDGAESLQKLKAAGGLALAQNPETAVIDNMPLSAMQAAGLSRGYELGDIALNVVHWLGKQA